jgi:flagellar basal body-associated protein FliL
MKKRMIIHIIFIIVLIVLANVSLYYFIYFDDIRKNNTFQTELYVNQKSHITYNIQTPSNTYYNYKNLKEYDINNISKIDVLFFLISSK